MIPFLKVANEMANQEIRSLARSALKVAGAGLGAVLAGPLGGAIGQWLGEELGASAAKLLKESKFGEKIVDVRKYLSSELRSLRTDLQRDETRR